MEIEDYIYNADGTVTIVYADGSTSTNQQTQNQGGYTSGVGGTTGGGGYSNTGGGKKWWETAIGVLPSIFTSIFGGNAQAQNQYPYGYPTTTTSGGSNGGMNTIIIVAVAAVVILLLMNKK